MHPMHDSIESATGRLNGAQIAGATRGQLRAALDREGVKAGDESGPELRAMLRQAYAPKPVKPPLAVDPTPVVVPPPVKPRVAPVIRPRSKRARKKNKE